MKKKIINGIMMVALVAATSTSFVSCKDTNEDVRVEQAIEIAALQGRLTTLENQYGDLDGRVSAMKNRLDDVEALALDNAADIALLEVQVEEIEEDIDNLQLWLVETFAKLVTSVEISGTYNNMTGSINVPGFEPKMLIFNYGVASKDGSFPESLDAADRLEWVANEEIGAGEYNPGNAGCIYANVNRYIDDLPLLAKWQWDYIEGDAKAPFFDFALVNTAGEKAEGVVIGNMNIEGYPTTDVLQWGWTRADNNIFKFGVVYEGDEASNFTPAKVDLSLLKNDLKAIWADRNRWSGTSKESLGRLVADLYYNYATRDTNLKKYALKISWKDNTTYAYDKDGETIVESDEEAGLEHMVTSEAELVFAAIKPLAFTSGDALASVADSHVKGANNLIEKMEPYIDKILNKIKKQINIKSFDESIFYDGTIAISDGTGNVPAGHYILTIPGADLDVATAQPAGTCVDLEVDIDDIVEPIKGAYENANDMMNDIKNILGKVNGTNIGNWMEKFTNRFNTLFANNADQMLQPTLLAINNGVVNRVSGIKSAPYVADGEVTLKPTTYTAELFAPAYAKYVGCKDIDADNFNKIIFSGAQELKFTPEAGKLYEIVYEAVDYFGNTVKNTYYIQGK